MNATIEIGSDSRSLLALSFPSEQSTNAAKLVPAFAPAFPAVPVRSGAQSGAQREEPVRSSEASDSAAVRDARNGPEPSASGSSRPIVNSS